MSDSKPPTWEQFERDVKAVLSEIDPLQMETQRRMTPAQKIRAVSDLFDSMKALAIASEKHRHPERSDEENTRRAMARWMRASEWEPELRKEIFGF
jgi:hypothetical protein